MLSRVMPPLFNRELSWLEFDRRVLAQAEDPSVPLLERLKFLSITSTNLDEFLMVRVGTLRSRIAAGRREKSPDGMTPRQQLKMLRTRVKSLQKEMYRTHDAIRDALQLARVKLTSAAELNRKQQAALLEIFETRIAPVLTPLAFDPGHPFPFLASGSLNLALIVEAGPDVFAAFIKIPRLVPRFIAVPGNARTFLPVEELIRVHAASFFPGLKVRETVTFRVLRNADVLIREDEVEDLLESMESELRRRDRKEAVWMEAASDASPEILALLQRELELGADDTYLTPSLPRLGDLMELYEAIAAPELKDPPFHPRMPSELATTEDIFAIVRARDVLLHRPYDSYAAVIELVESAADDPDVIAIKQTLYRTEPGSVIVEALARAAERGKQVTVVVEVQARFDEARNIAWARRLEEAGVQVVYGLVGIKIHAKVCLIIRREGEILRHYVHLSTGNYNARTAKLYTDIDLLTADSDITADAAQLMNLITGYSSVTAQELFESEHARSTWKWRKLVAAPIDYHDWVLRMIARESEHARAGRPAEIIVKMNSLVEPAVIAALYDAADAGVRIQAIVRGICCLVPRQNIRVVSIIGRFLEHSRIMLFRNGGKTEIYATSGDWMPRNFFRRIELTWPILDPRLREIVEEQIVKMILADDAGSWRLHPDGTYTRRRPGPTPRSSQQHFIETARTEAGRVPAHEEAFAARGRRAKKARKRK
jgi:polyphosphate kinase